MSTLRFAEPDVRSALLHSNVLCERSEHLQGRGGQPLATVHPCNCVLALQVVDDNLGFTKDRTISRLIEMQSREYLTQHAEKHAPELLLALYDRKGNRRSRSTSRHERGGLRSSIH
jgi:hypothetical protein